MLGRLAAVVGSGAAVAAYHHGFVGKTPTSRILAEEADTALPVPQSTMIVDDRPSLWSSAALFVLWLHICRLQRDSSDD